MDYDEELKIERFKIITDRQKYFTELSKDTYNVYLKTFVYIVMGSVALISLQEKFNVPIVILKRLIEVLIILLVIVGVSAILQICFCLVRWYKLKRDEKTINANVRIESWAWLYEGLYIFSILASMLIIIFSRSYISEIVNSSINTPN